MTAHQGGVGVSRELITFGRRDLRRSLTSIGALLAGCVSLTACSYGDYGYELRESQVVGTWVSTSEVGTEITLNADQTMTASAWPSNLNCDGENAEDVDSMVAAPTSDFIGTWNFSPGIGNNTSGGMLASVYLEFDSHLCTQRGPLSYFRIADDGTVSMCFSLEIDPDNFSSGRALAFLKPPTTAATEANACR